MNNLLETRAARLAKLTWAVRAYFLKRPVQIALGDYAEATNRATRRET